MKFGTFYEDWLVDYSSKKIKRKVVPFLKRIFNWNKKYKLSEFHGWAREMEASEKGMSSPHILNSDAMKPVKGIPKKLELANGWRIESEDINSIVGDGYVLIENGNLLVPEKTNRILNSIEAKPGFAGFSVNLKKLFGIEK